MCNCINEIQDKMRDLVKCSVEKESSVAEWTDEGRFLNKGYNFHGGPTKIAMPFQFSFIKKKKNGDPEQRTTNRHVDVYGDYCPFCGEKHPELKD